MDRRAWRVTVHGVKKSQESTKQQQQSGNWGFNSSHQEESGLFTTLLDIGHSGLPDLKMNSE